MIRAWLKHRKSRSTEQEMMANRVMLGVAAAITSLLLSTNHGITLLFCLFLGVNEILRFMQKRSIATANQRIGFATILDNAMAGTIMIIEPAAMAFIYPLFMWESLGLGFRLGLRWLFFGSCVTTLTFSIVVFSTDYWQQNRVLGIGLILALIIIPAYCSTLIRKLSRAKDQAEVANRAKSYFLASVSHELRTPLNAIIGYGNHLQKTNIPKNHMDMIDASVGAGEHLLYLIDQLIQVAKSDSDKVEIKYSSFAPASLLTEIRDIMAVRADEKGLKLHIQADPLSDQFISAPKEMLKNVLINLVGNAIKFTGTGTVAIQTRIETVGNDISLSFSISDSGIGIEESAQDRIFKPFQQADETVLNRFGGTGLGLAICKQLVEQMSGTISVSSKLGLGSTFSVNIPVQAAAIDEKLGDEQTQQLRILSLGRIEQKFLSTAQSVDGFSVHHIESTTLDELVRNIGLVDLQNYSVAVIDEQLARQIEPENPIWAQFANAEVAPVLVKSDNPIELEDLSIRAAFASIVPASADFDSLRSAIRIGCSFAHQPKFDHDKPNMPHAALPAQVIEASGIRVLVADDNRTNRNVLKTIVESAGHEVLMATDGDEALEVLDSEAVDILLLDVNMPRLNGIDMCKMWRQIEGNRKHLPIIGVTADATAETKEKCLAAGMDLRLTKPVNSEHLLAVINEYCEVEMNAPLSSISDDPFGKVTSLHGHGKNTTSHSIDPAQIDYLRSIGDEIFLANMVTGFQEDLNEMLPLIREAVISGDVAKFRFAAHGLKSSSNNIGAVKLASMGAKLEKITEADFYSQGVNYVALIDEEASNVEIAISQLSQITPVVVAKSAR
jgi:two-component system, sensor histidine kinase RpfC